MNMINIGYPVTPKELYVAQISTEHVPMKNLSLTGSVPISFTDEDMKHVTNPHNDMLVITTEINEFDVKRIPVESRSLIFVIFYRCLISYGENEE